MWFSALSGLSGQDTNLSSIKIAVRLFFCLARTVRLLGERLPGYYLHSRIFSALPCDTVSKQHIIQLHPALFLKSALLMRLLLHLSISILTSCLNTLPGAFLRYYSLQCPMVRHPKHSHHRLSGKHADVMKVWVRDKPVRRQTAVAPPQAIALWLLVTIVPLRSQALTSGDNGHGGKEEREPASMRMHKYVHPNTHKHIRETNKLGCIQN